VLLLEHGRSSSVGQLLEAGSYLRFIDSCITQLKAQGPSGTCNESKEEEERQLLGGRHLGFQCIDLVLVHAPNPLSPICRRTSVVWRWLLVGVEIRGCRIWQHPECCVAAPSMRAHERVGAWTATSGGWGPMQSTWVQEVWQEGGRTSVSSCQRFMSDVVVESLVTKPCQACRGPSEQANIGIMRAGEPDARAKGALP